VPAPLCLDASKIRLLPFAHGPPGAVSLAKAMADAAAIADERAATDSDRTHLVSQMERMQSELQNLTAELLTNGSALSEGTRDVRCARLLTPAGLALLLHCLARCAEGRLGREPIYAC
jgi:hypothetical protein